MQPSGLPMTLADYNLETNQARCLCLYFHLYGPCKIQDPSPTSKGWTSQLVSGKKYTPTNLMLSIEGRCIILFEEITITPSNSLFDFQLH